MNVDAFSLLMDARAAFAELMAECPQCGAIATQVLELAWRARRVTCSECLTAMPLDGDVPAILRKQSADAMATIDRIA